jgi:hypothetical protein
MIDLLHLKTLLATVAPAGALIVNGPKLITTAKRWTKGRPRKKETAILLEMRRFAVYEESPVALKAATLREVVFAAGMFVACILCGAMAVAPSSGSSDHVVAIALALEALAMLAISMYSLDRVTTRLNRAHDPQRTRLRQEIRLIRALLDRVESDIASRKGPLLRDEADSLRIISSKLPAWSLDLGQK